jgi:ZIP family zinc transporter
MSPAVTALMFACATWVSTGLGGLAALRYRDRRHLLLGFSAGAVLGLVFFDLVPEAFALAPDHRTLTLATAAGFLAFFALERATALHRGREHAHAVGRHDPELGATGSTR